MDTQTHTMNIDLPELYPPFEVTSCNHENCELCGTEEIPLPFPLLTRSLSEHHCGAAMVKMAREKRKCQWAGTFNSIHGDSGWLYSLEREQVTRKGKPVREVDRISIRYDCDGNQSSEYRSTDTLPIATQCCAHVTLKINKTGKGANKVPPRCKNRTYGWYCHLHR
jgi:hypothetical protein